MSFRKHTGLLLIVLILAAQLMLAQHAKVHFFEDQHITLQQQGHDHSPSPGKEPGKDRICQVCVTAKVLSNFIACAGFIAAVILSGFALSLPSALLNLRQTVTASYSSRAPPAFLST